MEFRFNVNRLLPKKINRISHTLIPEDFRGDRREYNECQRLVSRVLDEMGEASATAQGLSKPITSAAKLRDTDHLVYLLVDSQGNNGVGTVVGLLKTGSKNLFMFDENGLHYQLKPRCILDFYIHESRQRTGLGSVLYQHMLAEEKTKPVKLAIDRPSEKFLQFLRKHYGLDRIIPQNNKFVVFQGFFDDEAHDPRSSRYGTQSRSNGDEDTCGSNNHAGGNNNCKSATSNSSAPYSGVSRSAYGRYAAARPPCSMANIIHNATVLGQTAERTGESCSAPSKLERPRSLSLYSEEERKHRASEQSEPATPSLPERRAAPPLVTSEEAEPQRRRSAAPAAVPPMVNSRAPSAAFGTLVERRPTDVFTNIEVTAEPEKVTAKERTKISSAASAKSSVVSATASKRETYTASRCDTGEKTSGVKASPSCAQEVGGSQSAHLDLKFYHSPLW